jgi:uncharacterized LabA/DUF88 family protein
MRTHVYVDGFNFYYGCVRGTPFKWLDFRALFLRLLPSNDVRTIKYFTARVEARPGDPGTSTRQQTYFRALRTLPDFEIILGHFLTHAVTLPRVDGKGYATVWRTEEKGSDVNLATHVLHDAHRGLIDCAVVVSNDSDLAEPIRIVHEELGIKVGLISPTYLRGHPSRELVKHAHFVKRIREGVLRVSQLPNPVQDPHGPIHKPPTW